MGRATLDEALLIEIELKRKQMIQSGLENGLQSDKTLQLSKQVDRLINAFDQSQSAKSIIQIINENNL
ncbi:Spo0E family sporulation regulatory protein-aspartic acid phosphatase [Solibacillus silvestris]|uniref:Spo0E family sporulation regulatory protein-aspartic acid phosphatase n=1 Tax=Solibacillus silvestris TaxID=76853 RepID=UPI003F7ECC40